MVMLSKGIHEVRKRNSDLEKIPKVNIKPEKVLAVVRPRNEHPKAGLIERWITN